MLGTIIPKDDDNVLDLFNVDYVCKVSFVEGDFIVEKLTGEDDANERGEK